MQLERDLEICEKILAEKHPVVALHVEQFDRKHVGGTAQLFKGEDQRRGIALADPPFGDGVKILEIGGAGAFDHAQNVQVRVLRQELPRYGGPIEDDRAQVVVRRRFQPFYKFCKLRFHSKAFAPCARSFLADIRGLLPTAACTPPAKSPAPEPAKSASPSSA